MNTIVKRTLQILLFLNVILCAENVFSQSAVIDSLNGSVEYRMKQDGSWEPASKGVKIPTGGSVRTGERSRAILLFPNKSRIWLKSKTSLDVNIDKKLLTHIKLFFGSIKVRVPHLKLKEKFKIRSNNAVMAVRGTVLTVDAGTEGEQSVPDMNVLFGEVKVEQISPESGRVTDEARVPQGYGYSGGSSHLLSREQELSGLEDWSPGLNNEQRRKEIINTVKKRTEIRQFASQVQSTEKEISDSRQSIKEEDFAAGRTLIDVHGNLVRVDQRLDRPDGNSVQILNVVKRQSYGAGGLRKYSYSGPAGSRLDSLKAKVEFNKNLPENINDFPGFFSKNEDSLKVERSELVLANTSSADSVFVVGLFGKRNVVRDDVDADLYIGTLTSGGGETARKKQFDLRQQSDNSVRGLTRFVEDGSIGEITEEALGGELYGNFANRWVESGNTANKVWLTSEFFVINNDGGVRNLSDYTNGSTDFESLLKNTAGEVVVFVKEDAGTIPNNSVDATTFQGGNSTKSNIDIVFIPDIFLSVVKSLASSLDKISSSLDSSVESLSNAK